MMMLTLLTLVGPRYSGLRLSEEPDFLPQGSPHKQQSKASCGMFDRIHSDAPTQATFKSSTFAARRGFQTYGIVGSIMRKKYDRGLVRVI